jgi:serine-type D-Ala-D-Ala carboxypeptidase/endopeptidase
MFIQQSIKELVDQYFQPLICLPANGNSPSAATAPGGICGVFYGGFNYYFGFGTIDDHATVPDKNTVFGVGSVTKTFTTSILGQNTSLYSGTDTANWEVNNYLPQGYTLSPAELGVTFEQLATFTAGIPDLPPEGQSTNQQQFINFINAVNQSTPTFPLPTSNLYSDSSIGFLGQVLMSKYGFTNLDSAEEATAWWQQNLFNALSMNYTGAPAITDETHPLSQPFFFNEKTGQYQEIKNGYAPWTPWGTAGRAFSTCRDMMKFIRANCGETMVDGKPVSANILTGMANAQKNWAPPEQLNSGVRQGFAWIIINPNSENPIAGKDGSVPGVSSFVTVCPTQKTGVIFLTNMENVPVKNNIVSLTEALIGLS